MPITHKNLPRNFPKLTLSTELVNNMACSDKSNLEQQILMDNRDFIVNYLDADFIIEELIQERLLSRSAAQSLIGKSRVDKNKIVFEQLSNAGPGVLERFRKILKNQRRQTSISKELEKRKSSRKSHAVSVWIALGLMFEEGFARVWQMALSVMRLRHLSRACPQ